VKLSFLGRQVFVGLVECCIGDAKKAKTAGLPTAVGISKNKPKWPFFDIFDQKVVKQNYFRRKKNGFEILF
jgi:hypothetical protein